MPKHVRDENTAASAQAQVQHPPAKVSKSTSTCEYCSKKFTTRGITRHQNSCQKKKTHDETEAKSPFKFPIQNNSVFEYFLQFLSNQTLTKLQIATGDYYKGCEPDLAQYCCSCDEDNLIIVHGLCRECESKLDSYMPRTTKKVAKNNYGVRDKNFQFLPCEVRKHYTLFDRVMLENHMIETCGSKLEWVRFIAKKDKRKKKLQATLQRKEKEASDFIEGLAPGFAEYMRAIDIKKTDKEELEQCSQRFATLKAALEQRGLKIRNDSCLCKEFITIGHGNIWSIVDTMEEMNFLFTHTDYVQRCGRNIKYMREEDDMLGGRMWIPKSLYREMIQDCRDDAKVEIRDEYLKNDRGLTLPRKWEKMRSNAKPSKSAGK